MGLLLARRPVFGRVHCILSAASGLLYVVPTITASRNMQAGILTQIGGVMGGLLAVPVLRVCV
jgi:hypothetical protein